MDFLNDNYVRGRILYWMNVRGINQVNLAELAGISAPTLNKILNDTSRKITLRDIVSIAMALDINPAVLLSDNDVYSSSKEDETVPESLHNIFKNIKMNIDNEIALEKILGIDLPYSMIKYSNAAKGILASETRYKVVRGKYSKKDPYIKTPWVRVLVPEMGRSFDSALRVSYYFDLTTSKAYLAIVYLMPLYTSVSKNKLSNEKVMVEYYRALASDHTEIRARFSERGKVQNIYGGGCIHSIEYDLNDIPDDTELVSDLQQMVDLFFHLLNESATRMSQTYQNILQKRMDDYKAKNAIDKIDTKGGTAELDKILPVEDEIESMTPEDMGKAVRECFAKEQYKCELNPEHITFINKNTGNMHMAPRELVPFNHQIKIRKNYRKFSSNWACLCPTCDALLDFAEDSEREEAFAKLYMKHKEGFVEQGIDISLAKFLEVNGIK